MTASYVVLLPVKPPSRGKSRLEVDPGRRRALAAAFALDTARACLGAARVASVLAVTDDARFADELRDAGCDAIPDGVAGDLNESLRLAAAEGRRRWPDRVPVVVCADLPALRAADLDEALTTVSTWGVTAFVADRDGVGTTLYTSPYDDFDPHFGAGSRQAHLDAGAREIAGELLTLRADVDDARALAGAEALGLGAHTRLAMLLRP
ncbi:MAG TPA: 2-phospho-L-lactate guanylyltransferase [Nocardioides sp.]|jgi:2-phospho-L-lactate guanylyltransferase|uniref:2-phospho-L-lactate guanylyltransferase n=1 Tax=Nocardioides sp. TaxID=35761 RepID=UPI002E36254F|nr:2-phospho-L-lactate guanylyltransferase [Nocardioides sp.]HEX3931449.1 2-phospho-L-lactate guanylyltransferase [Nocardioides sp.]